MYKQRHNVWPDAPGHWTSADGEYEFLKIGKTWTARERTHGRVFAITSTLTEALIIAGRYYAHPVVPVDNWQYVYMCESDGCDRLGTCTGGTIGGNAHHYCSFHMEHGAEHGR